MSIDTLVSRGIQQQLIDSWESTGISMLTECHRVEGEFSWQGRYESIVGRFERGELRQVSEDYLYGLRNLLSEIVTRRTAESPEVIGRQGATVNILGEIDYLLTTRFGVEMVILRPVPPSSG